MSDVYKLIHSVKHFNDYISIKTRLDGRNFNEHRNIKLNIGPIKTADASAVVKCGNTTIVCGIELNLAMPKAEEPDLGFVVTNVELPASCHPKYRPGPPSDYAQTINNIVSEIIKNSKLIDLKDLCIVPDKLVWVLYCDLICFDNDGSLVDACIMALVASLKTLFLPSVTYESEDISVDTSVKKKLAVHGTPVATSFAVYEYFQNEMTLLMDPTNYEEDMCGGHGANLIISYNNGLMCGIHKFGGGSLSTKNNEEAMKLAEQHTSAVEKVIRTCLEGD